MTRRATRLARLALAALLAISPLPVATAAADDPAPRLAAGPMPGHSAMRAATLWLQLTAAADVRIDYWPEGRPGELASSSPAAATTPEQYAVHIELTGLEPGTRYAYRVIADGKALAADDALHFRTQPLWQWRGDPPPFRLLAGSCAYINETAYDRPGRPYGDRYDIFATMAAQSPDMMLWLGDNVYLREADYDSRWGMAERYRHTRALPELQPLLRAAHHYAIWDDHDYGPDNASRSFVRGDTSHELFRRYWANPSYGVRDSGGIFTQVNFHDVDFFLLDNRSWRDQDRTPDGPGKSMFGAGQLGWLKDALLASRAPFKIIASGSQLLNDLTGKEAWTHFPDERAAFLAWLETAGVDGVLLLSGDTHYSALFRLPRAAGYPLHELTCSPLTAGTHRRGFGEENPRLVPGTYVAARNFCQLDVSGPRDDRTLRISVIDADGETRWTHDIHARELTAAQ
jgi:alkaline phosphatase D